MVKTARWLGACMALVAALVCAAPVHAENNITVYKAGSVAINETRQLTAYVPLSPNAVTWSVNGVPGGDATVGTISASGLYQAPARVPTNAAVSVRATSTAYPDKSHAVTLNITQVPVQLWSVSPTSALVGTYTLSLNGANFNEGSTVTVGDAPVNVTYVSVTRLRISGTTTAAQVGQKLGIKVTNPGLGATTSGSVAFAVAAPATPGTQTPNPTPDPIPASGVNVTLSPSAASLAPFGTRQFTATVTGSTNVSVVYSVNGIEGGNASVGTISGSGLYTAPATTTTQLAVTIRAVSQASAAAAATAVVTISGPPNAGASQGTANLAAARFLNQATFGATPGAIGRVQQIGINAWLDEQFAMAETPFPSLEGLNAGTLKAQYVSRLATAEDQLRQRVAYALGQIIVISMNKNIYPPEIVPYLQILSSHAFGNYRNLLGEISVSSQMGKYLDIANSNRPTMGRGANENYPRELMQLFTIGLWQLGPDGTPALDANRNPIPTYDQAAVQQVALAFTGWTYPGTGNNNWENFSGPMLARDINHDTRQKTLLGCTLPAGQGAVADMNGALDCLFRHPNVGPFVATRLIRALVTSDPTPAYVARVAAVFDNNGLGTRGDLRATVRAILTDAEAREGAPERLRDPIQHLAAFTRALNGSIRPGNQLSWQLSQMGQDPLTPPSVFGHYSPLYRIPRTATPGPEFQIYAPTEAVLRGNLLWQAIVNPAGSEFTLDLSPFASAASPVELIDRVDQALLYGRMPQGMRQSIANVMAAQQTASERMQMALYLTAISGLYAVQN